MGGRQVKIRGRLRRLLRSVRATSHACRLHTAAAQILQTHQMCNSCVPRHSPPDVQLLRSASLSTSPGYGRPWLALRQELPVLCFGRTRSDCYISIRTFTCEHSYRTLYL
ncbi:hypothetical protein ANANG_G00241200 [Anguilla anguilla]|uniref:Uncharacterized protein n=1 Tax=Anguilla anguilla TaxID=7936 RepID=A0A9D3RS38_ANGAN|nr:hypothetical protein ANANG_G00241200 [Anguilla anguilla]